MLHRVCARIEEAVHSVESELVAPSERMADATVQLRNGVSMPIFGLGE